ncbi:hypothetical protein E2C01_095313 [Portunus trituberculatus]|uniref:Uncharacterized protein n=1 Tax=Portunus trituberculatus TaxID=210409 RepID=A0A5B7JYE9_PORTR|nr:hypothetical protein [Portunus trituberculatus]
MQFKPLAASEVEPHYNHAIHAAFTWRSGEVDKRQVELWGARWRKVERMKGDCIEGSWGIVDERKL